MEMIHPAEVDSRVEIELRKKPATAQQLATILRYSSTVVILSLGRLKRQGIIKTDGRPERPGPGYWRIADAGAGDGRSEKAPEIC